MRPVRDCDFIVISVDPGMAANRLKSKRYGKPIAVTATAFLGDEAALVAFATGGIERGDTFLEALQKWHDAVLGLVRTVMVQHRVPIIVFAIEDARGRGAKGWKLQALVVHLVEQWNTGAYDMATYFTDVTKPARVIHPATVKKLATGDGHASAEQVAQFVRMTVLNTEILPSLEDHDPKCLDYDHEAAVSVALAAHSLIKMEQLEAMNG